MKKIPTAQLQHRKSVRMEPTCSIKAYSDVHVPSHHRFTSNGGQGADRFHLTSTCGPSPLESETKRKYIIWRCKIGERIWSNWQCQDSESLAVSLPRTRTERDAGGLVKCAHFTHHFTWAAHMEVRRSSWHRGVFGRHKVSAGLSAFALLSWRNICRMQPKSRCWYSCGLGW